MPSISHIDRHPSPDVPLPAGRFHCTTWPSVFKTQRRWKAGTGHAPQRSAERRSSRTEPVAWQARIGPDGTMRLRGLPCVLPVRLDRPSGGRVKWIKSRRKDPSRNSPQSQTTPPSRGSDSVERCSRFERGFAASWWMAAPCGVSSKRESRSPLSTPTNHRITWTRRLPTAGRFHHRSLSAGCAMCGSSAS